MMTSECLYFLQGGAQPDTKTKTKFSSFFNNVVVELDKELYGPDNHLAEWHRSSSSTELDGFTVSYSFLKLSLKIARATVYTSARGALIVLELNGDVMSVCNAWPQVTRPGEGTVKCTILLTLNYQV